MTDEIDHPEHYTDGGYETWDFIEDVGLNYKEGNAVKYISRAGKKTTSSVKDIQKAIAYIQSLVNDKPSEKLNRFATSKKLERFLEVALYNIYHRHYTSAVENLNLALALAFEVDAQDDAAPERGDGS